MIPVGSRVEFESLKKSGVMFRGTIIGYLGDGRYVLFKGDNEDKPRHVSHDRLRLVSHANTKLSGGFDGRR